MFIIDISHSYGYLTSFLCVSYDCFKMSTNEETSNVATVSVSEKRLFGFLPPSFTPDTTFPPANLLKQINKGMFYPIIS